MKKSKCASRLLWGLINHYQRPVCIDQIWYISGHGRGCNPAFVYGCKYGIRIGPSQILDWEDPTPCTDGYLYIYIYEYMCTPCAQKNISRLMIQWNVSNNENTSNQMMMKCYYNWLKLKYDYSHLSFRCDFELITCDNNLDYHYIHGFN